MFSFIVSSVVPFVTQPLHQESMLNCAHVHEYEAEAARLCAFLDLECLESHAVMPNLSHTFADNNAGVARPNIKDPS